MNSPISVEYTEENRLATLFFCSSLCLIVVAGLLYRCFGQWIAALLSFLALLFLVAVVSSNPHAIVHFYAFYVSLFGAVVTPQFDLWKLKLWPSFWGLNAILVTVVMLLYWAGTKGWDIGGLGIAQRVWVIVALLSNSYALNHCRYISLNPFKSQVVSPASLQTEVNEMKASNSRCSFCVGAWLILVASLSLSTVAQVSEESRESPWQAICRLTEPIVAVNNKSLDRVDLENSFSTLKRDATPFTEHEIVSLILLAGSIEQKSYDEQRLCSRLAAIRLADHCQDEIESKMLEAATGAHFSRLDSTVLSAITILEWRFPESVSSIIHKVLLEPNEPGWLQEHTSWYLASLVVADGDQRQVVEPHDLGHTCC